MRIEKVFWRVNKVSRGKIAWGGGIKNVVGSKKFFVGHQNIWWVKKFSGGQIKMLLGGQIKGFGRQTKCLGVDKKVFVGSQEICWQVKNCMAGQTNF